MSKRKLYLALYDIANPRRLAATLALVRNHSYGGQKSAYEVYLSDSEKHDLLTVLAVLLDEQEDRFLLLQLNPRAKVYTLGIAKNPQVKISFISANTEWIIFVVYINPYFRKLTKSYKFAFSVHIKYKAIVQIFMY